MVKVLYVCSADRSGSTLLDRLLGQTEGFFSLGEMTRFIWRRGLEKNQRCGCGEHFRDCSFWNEVMDQAWGGMSQPDLERIRELEKGVTRIRHIPQIAYPGLAQTELRRALAEYVPILENLVQAVREVADKPVLIDTSKRPIYGYLLQKIPSVDLRVVHLVRDSRGVVHSWQRRKERPEVREGTEYMEQKSARLVAWHWNLRNSAAHLFRMAGISYARVRYEDLAERPTEVLWRLRDYMGHGEGKDNLTEKSVFELEEGHTVSGNPMRFKTGEIRVELDAEWKKRIDAKKKFLVSMLTLPLLFKYGYKV